MNPTTPEPTSADVNFNVNSSVWGIIRHKYWWEAGLLVPLFIVWEYLLFRYVGPVLFSGHSNANSGKGFGTLVILPVTVFIAWFHRLQKQVEDAFLTDFALVNGYTYEAVGTVDETYGSVFRLEGTQQVSDIVEGSYNGQPLRLFLYDLTRGMGRNQTTYRNTVMELTLPGQVPPMMLSAKRSHNSGLNISAASGISNTISLEGDFNQFFTLHAPAGTQIEALEVFAPNIMAIIEDNSRGFDIEFVADKIYIYLDKYVNTSADLNQLFKLAKLLITNVAPVAARLVADSAIAQPTMNLSQARLRPTASLRAKVVFVIAVSVVVVAGVLLGILVAQTPPQNQAYNADSNPAYTKAANQAEADIASSTQAAPRGAQILADGQAVLAASRTALGRSGAQYYIGMGYYWERSYQAALDHENQSLSEDPKNSAAIVIAAQQLVNLGRNNEAIAMANRELALDPKDGSALRTRAFAEANLGSRTAALNDIDTATALDAADPSKASFAQYNALDRNLVVAAYRPLLFEP